MQCILADTLYTGRAVLKDATVCFQGDRIVSAGRQRRGEQIGRFPVVTPAFIDAHNHIGMARAGEPENEAEYNEQMDSVITLTDALDSVQMDDTCLTDAVEMGVLYSCVMPGSANIIGGLSAVIRHYAPDTSSALIGRAGLKAAFGFNPTSVRDWKGTRPSTRMGAMAILRGKLAAVREKMRKRRVRPARGPDAALSAAEQVLRDVLKRKLRLRAHVHKINDIAALLRLADEFGLDVSIEHACDVHQVEIFRQLRGRRIPVIFGPMDAFAYKTELKHANWRNVRVLVESGVTFGLMSDHPVTPCRQLLLQTRWLLRAGVSRQQAIELLTRVNARLLGVDRQLGTLARGKWASLVGWNGDPFDLASYPAMVVGEGKTLFAEGRPAPSN